jgi:hypothetical protein
MSKIKKQEQGTVDKGAGVKLSSRKEVYQEFIRTLYLKQYPPKEILNKLKSKFPSLNLSIIKKEIKKYLEESRLKLMELDTVDTKVLFIENLETLIRTCWEEMENTNSSKTRLRYIHEIIFLYEKLFSVHRDLEGYKKEELLRQFVFFLKSDPEVKKIVETKRIAFLSNPEDKHPLNIENVPPNGTTKET